MMHRVEHTYDLFTKRLAAIEHGHDLFRAPMEWLARYQRVAEDQKDYALMAVSARMAFCLGIMYALEDRQLLLLEPRMRQYFVDRGRQLDEPLVDHSSLIGVFYHRSFENSIFAGIVGTADLRREIYVLLNRYSYNVRIPRMARSFYRITADRKRELHRAYWEASDLFDQYLYDVSFVLNRTQAQHSTEVVDDIIRGVIGQENMTLTPNRAQELIQNYMPEHEINLIYREARRKIELADSHGCGCSRDERDSVDIEVLIRFEESHEHPER